MRTSLLRGALQLSLDRGKYVCLFCRRCYSSVSEKESLIARRRQQETRPLRNVRDAEVLFDAFQFHRYPSSRFRLHRRAILVPEEKDQSPLIKDILRRMDYWRTHPRRQIKQEMLNAWKQGSLINNKTGQVLPPLTARETSKDEVADLLADLYSDHLEMFDRRPPRATTQNNGEDGDGFGGDIETPRRAKAFPPLRATEVVNYVHDIYSAIRTLPVASIDPSTNSNSPESSSYSPHARLPGTCPYPSLLSHGFTQPRPGALLRTPTRPQHRTTFTSTLDFESHIYSLSFHRDISPRTINLILSALLSSANIPYLSYPSFHYALHALIIRKMDLFNARRVAGYMTQFPYFQLDIKLWNLFLHGSLKIENIRSFALILRELLIRRLETNTETWNLVLQMGIKLESHEWVSGVLQIMQIRQVTMDQDSLKFAFRVLKDVLSPERMREEYERYFGSDRHVPWKVFNVVLRCYCEQASVQEGWEYLLETLRNVNDLRNLEGQSTEEGQLLEERVEYPPEATLHLFIQMCLKRGEYDRAWRIIGEFRERWNTWPHSRGIATLFEYAYQKEEFSDMILLWEFAVSLEKRWKMMKSMIWRARDFEREYGIPLRRKGISSRAVLVRWKKWTVEGRNEDSLCLVQRRLWEHVKWMKARKLSLQLDDAAGNIPEDVRQWRQIEKTYAKAVSLGKWKPRPEPLMAPLPKINRSYISDGRKYRLIRSLIKIDPPSRRVESGLNFKVREKIKVWKMVQKGELKFEAVAASEMKLESEAKE